MNMQRVPQHVSWLMCGIQSMLHMLNFMAIQAIAKACIQAAGARFNLVKSFNCWQTLATPFGNSLNKPLATPLACSADVGFAQAEGSSACFHGAAHHALRDGLLLQP